MRCGEVINLGTVLAHWPFVLLAQQPKVVNIGVLVHSTPGWQSAF
jgi:hypothetical protein